LDLLRRQRAVILAALAAIAALAWLYLFLAAADMTAAMAGMDRTMVMPPRGSTELLLLFAMWWVMMVGMMLPSVAPVILTFATVNRNRAARGEPYVPSALFTAGYLLAWVGFSLAATLVQEGLERAALLSPMDMTTNSRLLGGLLFLAAGLYQFSPLKGRCLAYCRSPDGFILSEWRDGAAGAAVMGLRHGLFCLGCCAALMVLLFAVAVMDLRWVAALTALVTAEKLLPGARFWRVAIGAALLAAGAAFAVAAWKVAT